VTEPTEDQPRVLVVDDDPDIRLLLRSTLRREGFNVEVAATGEEGLDRAHEHQPDCVLLDVVMPGIDGHETCRRLRDDPRTRDCAIIMLTGKSVSGNAEMLASGADTWLAKPFDVEVLRALVRSAVRTKSGPEDA
jgi:DNA-binding response OmpR family regulator